MKELKQRKIDKYTILLMLILILTVIINLKYFNINSAIWHDEGEYLATMKSIASKVSYDINPQRPPLFPFIGGLLFKLFNSELIVRIILLLIPSILSIYFAYRLVSLLYNKRIAIFASIMMSVFYLQIFYTARVLVDVPLTLITYLTMMYFWKGHVIQDNKKDMIIFGLLLGLSFLTKFTSALIGFSILFFLLITERLKFLKNKNLWYGFSAFMITFMIYTIWSKITFNRFFAFTLGTKVLTQPIGETASLPIAWSQLQFFYIFPKIIFFALFLLGIITLIDLIIGFDLILKGKENKLKSDLFILIYIITFFSYFVFIERPQNLATDRWFLPVSLFMFILSAKGLDFIYNKIIEIAKNKYIAIGFALIILIIGAYFQLSTADSLIKEKKDTYKTVKEAALWIKDNSNKDDVIVTASAPETTYYSERKSVGFGYAKDFIKEKIVDLKPKFYVISVFEQHPDYAFKLIEYPEILKPVKSYSFNPNEEPSLVIFEFITHNLTLKNETETK